MCAQLSLDLSPGHVIAYHRLRAEGDGADKPGVVFLGGFKSDMTGLKAQYLETWASQRGRAFVRFDYRGHGRSSGDFEAHCIGDWAEDAAEVLRRLTEGPQILVGSSMGGWIALILAKRMPERVKGLMGIASAPDFTEDSMWAKFSEDQRKRLIEEGQLQVPSAYQETPYTITRHLIEDGRRNLVLRQPLRFPFPVRLLHGMADEDVPFSTSVNLISHMETQDAMLTLVRDADHRFSGEAELKLIASTLDEITDLYGRRPSN